MHFDCERAREHISLQLDGELSELEGEGLRLHLVRCLACSSYAKQVAHSTTLLREAPMERLEVPITLSAPRRALTRTLRVGLGATAAVVMLALGTTSVVLGTQGSDEPATSVPSPALGERQTWDEDSALEKPIATRPATSRGLSSREA